MRSRFCVRWLLLSGVLVIASSGWVSGQSSPAPAKTDAAVPAATLEREFFAAIREGDSKKVLAYVSDRGVNVGPQAQHVSRDELEQQLLAHRGIYCKLFDSACIEAPIKLDASARACSDRELLTRSEKVGTAATEATRNGVRQAILVARITNKECPNDKLIDFIFNLEADGWKLFSMP